MTNCNGSDIDNLMSLENIKITSATQTNCNGSNTDNLVGLDKSELTSKTLSTNKYHENTLNTTTNKENNLKRKADVLDWDEYFMASAFLVSKRSKDPVTRVGCVIINRENKIVGTGYNGMPTGCSDDEFPWGKNNINELDNKKLFVCHAEMNAILNKNSVDTKDCKLYSTEFPCNECAKIIIQSGIKEIVYVSDKFSNKLSSIASKKMFNAAKIHYWQYKPKNSKIIIEMIPSS